MNESEDQQRFREDAAILAQIGAALDAADLPEIEVRLPVQLAHAAVEAWERDETGSKEEETFEQRAIRHRAGALALIGLVVSEHGVEDGQEIVVRLPPALVGSALEAADDLPAS